MPTLLAAPCPSCSQPRDAIAENTFAPGSVCPHCGHVEPENEELDAPKKHQDILNPISELDTYIHKPSADKPGYLDYVGRLTLLQIAEGIKTRLPKEITNHLEWYGVPPLYTYKTAIDRPMRAEEELPKDTNLFVEWHPGGSEGYIVTIQAVRPETAPFSIWHAKLFSVEATICLHMTLMRILFCQGSAMDRVLAKAIVANLPAE